MATQTPRLGLTKPEATDEILATIAALAANMDTIDGIVSSAGTAPEGYVRFADGTQIAWKTVQTTAINNAHGGVYISAVVTAQPWPAAFFGDAPKVVSQTISDSGNAPRWHGHGTGLGSTSTTPPVWAVAGVSTTNTATIRMVGIGRWKE